MEKVKRIRLLYNEILPKTYPYSILINKYGNITLINH